MNLKQSIQELERKFMPQIKGHELSNAISILRKNGIKVQLKTIDPNSLQNSQRAVNKEKVQNIIKDIKGGKILASDNYIKRWLYC